MATKKIHTRENVILIFKIHTRENWVLSFSPLTKKCLGTSKLRDCDVILRIFTKNSGNQEKTWDFALAVFCDWQKLPTFCEMCRRLTSSFGNIFTQAHDYFERILQVNLIKFAERNFAMV